MFLLQNIKFYKSSSPYIMFSQAILAQRIPRDQRGKLYDGTDGIN